MPKGVPNKRYTPEFKKLVIETTQEEAAAYFNIGIGKLRELSNSENCPFVLWVGSKRLIKRKRMEAFLDGAYSI